MWSSFGQSLDKRDCDAEVGLARSGRQTCDGILGEGARDLYPACANRSDPRKRVSAPPAELSRRPIVRLLDLGHAAMRSGIQQFWVTDNLQAGTPSSSSTALASRLPGAIRNGRDGPVFPQSDRPADSWPPSRS